MVRFIVSSNPNTIKKKKKKTVVDMQRMKHRRVERK
jgi:hypothetical protein